MLDDFFILSLCAKAVAISICKRAFAAPCRQLLGVLHIAQRMSLGCCGVQVLAVPLPRRPLFPGNIMPVSVQDPRLVRELLELKRSR